MARVRCPCGEVITNKDDRRVWRALTDAQIWGHRDSLYEVIYEISLEVWACLSCGRLNVADQDGVERWYSPDDTGRQKE